MGKVLRTIRSDMLPIGWRQHFVTLALITRLVDANGRPLKLLGMVVIRLRLDNSHFHVTFIVTKHLVTTMIIGNEFPDGHDHAIRCMECIVESTRLTERILGSNKPKRRILMLISLNGPTTHPWIH